MTRLEVLEKKLDFIITLLQSDRTVTRAECQYTLHDWLDEWLKVYKAPSVKPSTLYTYDVAIRVHIKPNLPNLSLNLITGLELQKFLTSINAGRTRKAVHDVLKESFNTAHNLKIIIDNPMTAVKIPSHVQQKGAALEPAELTQFLIDIKGHTVESYFLFLFYTGCRRSEGLSLNINDIDFEKKLLHIRGTKTQTSNRVIPLFEKVIDLLNKITPNKDGFYFNFRADYVTHIFKKFCPMHKLHDLRHTFATMCLKAKIPLKVVQKWLGHSKLDTTADIYSHVTDEISHIEAITLDNFLTQKTAL